jgi:2'-5' RNA ligase
MPSGATARLFVAIDPPPAMCEALAAWAREALAGPAPAARVPRPEAVRLLRPDLMHLTVCFLGSRPVGEIEALCAALARCAGESFELALGAPLWLPPRRPHALAIAIGDAGGGLARLHERAVGELAGASSWEPERRRLRPHVTVARMRAGASPRGARRAGRGRGGLEGGERGPAGAGPTLPATPAGTFTATALRLYRSHLSAEGASYEELAECALAGPEG